MKGREFLKKSVIGSAVVVSLLILVNTLSTPAWAGEEEMSFTFVAVSQQVMGADIIILDGTGTVDAEDVEGDGSFTHFTPTGAPPFPVVASGTWEATKLIDFTPIGTYGAHAAGILEMEVNLMPSASEGSVIKGATMKVVCNIGPGGLETGEAEGVTLSVPDGPTFAPNPNLPTATIFSTGEE